MPRFCSVVNCSHRSNRDYKFRFFSFPSIRDRRGRDLPAGKIQREKWIHALRREDFPTTERQIHNRSICSAHFSSGYPSDNPEHPDYVPHRNMGNDVAPIDPNRYHRLQKRNKLKQVITSMDHKGNLICMCENLDVKFSNEPFEVIATSASAQTHCSNCLGFKQREIKIECNEIDLVETKFIPECKTEVEVKEEKICKVCMCENLDVKLSNEPFEVIATSASVQTRCPNCLGFKQSEIKIECNEIDLEETKIIPECKTEVEVEKEMICKVCKCENLDVKLSNEPFEVIATSASVQTRCPNCLGFKQSEIKIECNEIDLEETKIIPECKTEVEVEKEMICKVCKCENIDVKLSNEPFEVIATSASVQTRCPNCLGFKQSEIKIECNEIDLEETKIIPECKTEVEVEKEMICKVCKCENLDVKLSNEVIVTSASVQTRCPNCLSFKQSEIKIEYNEIDLEETRIIPECEMEVEVEKEINETFAATFTESSNNRTEYDSLEEPLQGQSPLKNPYKCDLCYKDFDVISDLKKHQKTHRHKSNICGKDFNLENGLQQHKRTHTEQNSLKICHKDLDVTSDSKKHQKTHRHKCDICGKDFRLEKGLKQHLRIHTGQNPLKSNLKKVSHKQVAPLICDICSKHFKTLHKLRKHQWTHRSYKCGTCQKHFNRPSKLKTHQLVHSRDKPFKCDMCDKQFTQASLLNTHKESHVPARNLRKISEVSHKHVAPCICDICCKHFNTLHKLRKHQWTHRSYKCGTCQKDFNRPSKLEAHLFVHSGEKPLKCDMCDKRFTQVSLLNTHKESHVPARKKLYSCNICDKSFAFFKHLKRHNIIHPEVNFIKCKICDNVSISSLDLKEHMRLHIGENLHKCGICEKEFNQLDQLKAHQQQHITNDFRNTINKKISQILTI